jgi:hypothetical protein
MRPADRLDGGRAREWEEQTGRGRELLPVQSQLPDERADDSPDGSGQTHHRRYRPKRDSHRCQGPAQKWHFNELVRDAVGRSSNERIDATINFRGKFRKHNKNKADGTLEVTLEGGATYLDLDVSGTEPIVTERPIVNFEPEDCHGVQDFHLSAPAPGY